MVILVVLSKRRVKKRRSLTEYVRAARKWRRKLCKLAAVLQGECTSVLVLFLLYRRSRVFLWVATAYMACLSVYEVNGAL